MKCFFIIVNPLIWSFEMAWTIPANDPLDAIGKMLARYDKGSEPKMAKVYASREDYFDRDDCLLTWLNKDHLDSVEIKTHDHQD